MLDLLSLNRDEGPRGLSSRLAFRRGGINYFTCPQGFLCRSKNSDDSTPQLQRMTFVGVTKLAMAFFRLADHS